MAVAASYWGRGRACSVAVAASYWARDGTCWAHHPVCWAAQMAGQHRAAWAKGGQAHLLQPPGGGAAQQQHLQQPPGAGAALQQQRPSSGLGRENQAPPPTSSQPTNTQLQQQVSKRPRLIIPPLPGYTSQQQSQEPWNQVEQGQSQGQSQGQGQGRGQGHGQGDARNKEVLMPLQGLGQQQGDQPQGLQGLGLAPAMPRPHPAGQVGEGRGGPDMLQPGGAAGMLQPGGAAGILQPGGAAGISGSALIPNTHLRLGAPQAPPLTSQRAVGPGRGGGPGVVAWGRGQLGGGSRVMGQRPAAAAAAAAGCGGGAMELDDD